MSAIYIKNLRAIESPEILDLKYQPNQGKLEMATTLKLLLGGGRATGGKWTEKKC